MRGLGLYNLANGLFRAALAHSTCPLLLYSFSLQLLLACPLVYQVGPQSIQTPLDQRDVNIFGKYKKFGIHNKAASKEQLLGPER
mmetsp:Transcript_2776/g.7752  ORF Transcript_2776/g.7752 Transcript_2776/m.7752 type:complete len:85 (+) Transcript_2776:387-641(+)